MGKILLFGVGLVISFLPLHTLWAQSSESVVRQWLNNQQIAVASNNKVKLLKNGADKFDALFQDIRLAEHSVHLDYFAMRNDSISNRLFNLLAVKHRQGVHTRALFDGYANFKSARPLKQKHLQALRSMGLEIFPFDPVKFPWVNHAVPRDHRKIAVIDGRIAYTGGMNVADYYILGIPKAGPWRDMQVRIEGPAAENFQQVFLESWNKETSQQLDSDEYAYEVRTQQQGQSRSVRISRQDSLLLHYTGSPVEWERAAVEAERTLKLLENDTLPYTAGPYRKGPLAPVPSQEHVADVAVLSRVPHRTPSIMRDFYITALDAAQEKVVLVNPYFTPTHKVNKALKRALKRGVEMEIMISTQSDVSFTPEIAMRAVNKLRKRGAKVFLFDAGFHHTKIMTVDGRFCCVGSVNLEARSLRYDYEINAVIFNPGTTEELIRMFDNDKQTSHELTDEVWRERSFWKKLLGTLGASLTWVI